MGTNSREKQREYSRKWRATPKGKQYLLNFRNELKIQVLTHYGRGKCQCVGCGESRLACLSIDHINGGGNQARKKDGRYGTGRYILLKRHGFPGGYQTLCMNCQFCKVVLDQSHTRVRER